MGESRIDAAGRVPVDPTAVVKALERLQAGEQPAPVAKLAAPEPAPDDGVEWAATSLGGPSFGQGLWSGSLQAGWPALGGGGAGASAAAGPFGARGPVGAPPPDPVAKLMADQRVRLSDSLAKTHGLDSEAAVRAACDPYLAELATRQGDPAYAALYDDALEAKAEALDRVRERDVDREMAALERALAADALATRLEPLKVRVPPGLQAMPVPQALGERAEAFAEATVAVTSFLADLTPVVGTAKALVEYTTGRDRAGFGKPLPELDRVSRALTAVMPAARLLAGGGAGAARALTDIASRTGRSTSEVLTAVRTARLLGAEAKALEGALAKATAGQALARGEVVLLRRAGERLEALRAGGPARQAAKRAAHQERVEARAAARGEGVQAAGGKGVETELTHKRQTHDVSCGPACGEMASGHHARTTPGSVAATEAKLMRQPEFVPTEGGMDGAGLADALERSAPVAGRVWKVIDPLPKGKLTHQQVRAGLVEALREGNGVAIVNTVKDTPQGSYWHWVVVRRVEGGRVLVHDPESKSASLEAITPNGFGRYHWTGDTVLAAGRR